jgi:hypothetical protein
MGWFHGGYAVASGDVKAVMKVSWLTLWFVLGILEKDEW